MIDPLPTFRDRRVELGLTRADVAKAIGIPVGTFGRWEAGSRWPRTRARFEAWCRVLGVSVSATMVDVKSRYNQTN